MVLHRSCMSLHVLTAAVGTHVQDCPSHWCMMVHVVLPRRGWTATSDAAGCLRLPGLLDVTGSWMSCHVLPLPIMSYHVISLTSLFQTSEISCGASACARADNTAVSPRCLQDLKPLAMPCHAIPYPPHANWIHVELGDPRLLTAVSVCRYCRLHFCH